MERTPQKLYAKSLSTSKTIPSFEKADTHPLNCMALQLCLSRRDEHPGLPTVTSSRQALTTTGGIAPMAASGTLPQADFSRKSPIGRSGVLTLSGYGIKVRMQC